ncbi:hypothetical protein EZV62_008389 [Acer yangbiense]|uniref:Late embryogenesis abundant protein LEA-2 subgroup domain-containing protein n=1 Tax=Acer yangbiense TaxID=1000413 RepID=A0A5C7IDI1_9ROSI|nr:hypothetical protein EZV62_008389 [Acer yangbiense]
MRFSSRNSGLIILLVFVSVVVRIHGASLLCTNARSRCFRKVITCPAQCPSKSSKNPTAKVCYVDCNSPLCQAVCKRKIIVNQTATALEQHAWTLDSSVEMALPAGRTRDYTWIQALGFLFDSETFSLEATRAATWDDKIDHLKFTYNGKELVVPEGHLSSWKSPESSLRVERTSNKNSVLVTLPEVAEISVNVVPVTQEDDRIHNYQIPSNDCFAHLEVQFRFYGLSSKVEGVLGRTYQPDFQNPVKPGVAMPVVGGEDKYRTLSLLSADCTSCIFSPAGVLDQENSLLVDYGSLDCTGSATSGNGIVCRK